MRIYNSTDSLIDYIGLMGFDSIYKEDGVVFPVKGNVELRRSDASDFLISSAYVGNRVAGFFQKLPYISMDLPTRGLCIYFVMSVPDRIVAPTFFCKNPEDIHDIVPKAIKVSAENSIPVVIVLMPNALNNYMYETMPNETLNWLAPYLGNSITSWNPDALKEKLKSAYAELIEELPQEPLKEDFSFFLSEASAPRYLFPLLFKEQAYLFSNISKIHTTPKEKKIATYIVNYYISKDVPVDETLIEQEENTTPMLCPGCPFAVIYAKNDLKNKQVFTSTSCDAIQKCFGIKKISYVEYLGLNNKKLNVETLFIGNINEMLPLNNTLIKNGTIVALNNVGIKSPLPVITNLSKFYVTKSVTFPYSCNNIKKSSVAKVSIKKCNCVKEGNKPPCIEGAKCVALLISEDSIIIDKNLCTGCKRCVSFCPHKAIS